MAKLSAPARVSEFQNRTINQDLVEILDLLPSGFVDLLFLDPPYNLNKTFNTSSFRQSGSEEYREWFESWFQKLPRILKPTASVYVCGDWRCAHVLHTVLEKHLIVRNRITWEREKGRGAKSNWKN